MRYFHFFILQGMFKVILSGFLGRTEVKITKNEFWSHLGLNPGSLVQTTYVSIYCTKVVFICIHVRVKNNNKITKTTMTETIWNINYLNRAIFIV